MSTAALLRIEIERSLADRFPAALSPAPRTIREVAATGIGAVDELVEGGLPVGAISELTGAESSGRTSLALAFVARRTAEGRVCAWVDVSDAFDPESAASNGVNLNQLLWVRCRSMEAAQKLKQRERPWTRLDQALRATDLLLQVGGFAAIVLDLGSTAREDGNRIPAATWFRFRQAADRARSSLVVLGRAAYAQSSAAVVLECSGQPGKAAGGTVLRSLGYDVARKREWFSSAARDMRKPPVSAWTVQPAWEAARQA
jgi:recombination protein RecA